MKTVTIVGGGIAGLALGLGLARAGVPVVLHEAGRWPRHRVCGEFLCGQGPEILERLGAAEVLAGAAQNRSTVWQAGRTEFWRELPKPVPGLSRYELDRRLAEALRAAGARVHAGSRVRPVLPREGCVLATGRERDVRSLWVGVKAHWADLPLRADLEVHLGRGAYVGLSRIEGGRVNVCGLFRRRRSALGLPRERLLAGLVQDFGMGALAERLARTPPVAGSVVGVAGLRFGRVLGRARGLLRLGDCQAVIEPFTGNGMSLALEAAACAVEPLRRWSRGELGWATAVREAEAQHRGRVAARFLAAGLLHPFLLHRPGQALLRGLAVRGLLPFNLFFRLTHE